MTATAKAALREVIAQRRDTVLSAVVQVDDVRDSGGPFVRVRLRGDALRGYRDHRPADAFKLHLPGEPGLPVPVPRYDEQSRLVWPDGPRPIARCFTVRTNDPDAGLLEFDALLHDDGATARWVREAAAGDEVSLTGWRTEFVLAPDTDHVVLIADMSALPAVEDISREVRAVARVTTIAADDPDVGDRLLAVELGDRAQVWIGAEAELARTARRIVLDDLAVPRDWLHASAYWKRGTEWEQMFDDSLTTMLDAIGRGLDVTDPGVLQSLTFD